MRRHRLRVILPAVLVAIGMAIIWRGFPHSRSTPAGERSSEPDERVAEGEQRRASPPRVVIVGAGISGLTTALELGRGGARVTVVDMSSVFGGHAVMSQGGVCVVDSPLHRELGLEDSSDLAYGDFMEWGEDADPDWVRYYTDNSRRDIYDWLTDLGVRFEEISTAPGNSVDRFHQPTSRGIGLVTPIYEACLDEESIEFVWNTQATRLLTEDGRVAGIEARRLREQSVIRMEADYVVLATGGFQSNLDMVREFWPAEIAFPERILIGSGRNSVGLGHRMAQQVGGTLNRMDYQWNYFTGIPDPRQPESNRGLSAANMHGILVNPVGQRFANLHNWAKEVMPIMLSQERATVWFVFDEASRGEFVISGSDWKDFTKVERLVLDNPELVHSADTIEELAEKAGLPADNLRATIDRYNELVEGGVDEDFHRFGPGQSEYSNGASPQIATAPYYAMQAWPLTRKSMGGVAIDLDCRVLDQSRQPIPGLYAVGELTGLAGINGKAALEGTFLGPCVVTGRVAARSILGIPAEASPPPTASQERCISCHDVTALIEETRPGYWHFEQSHTRVVERELNCLQCHAELAPYHEEHHVMNQRALARTCASCHAGEE